MGRHGTGTFPALSPTQNTNPDCQVTWTTGFGCLLASCAFLVYHNREVSYSSLLDLSISARQRRLYEQHGLNIERWTESVAEAKTLRKEITRIAADYDIEWKGELEHLAEDTRPLAEKIRESDAESAAEGQVKKSDKSHRDSSSSSGTSTKPASTPTQTETKPNPDPGTGKDKHLDIDKTIDEASQLAEETEEQRNKEKAAQRKGETVDQGEGTGEGSKKRRSSVEQGKERGKAQVGKNHERFE